MSVRLSDHFTAEEMRYYETPAPYRPNVLALVALLERLRLTWGVPIRVHSVYRGPVYNASLPGAARDSQHLDASAGDVTPIGLTYERALELVQQDTALQQMFGQFITYRSQSHFHIALPTRGKVGQILEQTSEDPAAPVYAPIVPGTRVAGLVADAPLIAAALLAAGVLVLATDA